MRLAAAWNYLALALAPAVACAAETSPRNPLVEHRREQRSSGTPGPQRQYGVCLRLELALEAVQESDALRGSLHVENHCTESLALLLEPIETIVRRPEDGWEMVIDPDANVAARLVVTSNDWYSKSRPHIDAGLQARGDVGYAVIPAAGSTAIPVTGMPENLKQLLAGQYEAVLSTYVAPSHSGTVHSRGRGLGTVRQTAQ